jgi:hypothetical protein
MGDGICSECETGNVEITCTGACLRSWHEECLQASALRSEIIAPFMCIECATSIHTCFSCKLPALDGDLVKCSIEICGKYYHNTHENTCYLKNSSKMSSDREFVCSRHDCHNEACIEFSNTGTSDPLMQCFRCTKAYHYKNSNCVPKENVQMLSNRYFHCLDHLTDEKQAPKLEVSDEIAKAFESYRKKVRSISVLSSSSSSSSSGVKQFFNNLKRERDALNGNRQEVESKKLRKTSGGDEVFADDFDDSDDEKNVKLKVEAATASSIASIISSSISHDIPGSVRSTAELKRSFLTGEKSNTHLIPTYPVDGTYTIGAPMSFQPLGFVPYVGYPSFVPFFQAPLPFAPSIQVSLLCSSEIHDSMSQGFDLTLFLQQIYPRFRCKVCNLRFDIQNDLAQHVDEHRKAHPSYNLLQLRKIAFENQQREFLLKNSAIKVTVTHSSSDTIFTRGWYKEDQY